MRSDREGSGADGEMPCSGKSDELGRKAGLGNFPGPPSRQRKYGFEKRGPVSLKPKEPFAIILRATLLIEKDNPRKGILKKRSVVL